ncbi:MAG: Zn-dependent exopeptidase M28 [Rhodobacteraceae bacterium]|nr:MAG: Zn-dependent exopeptidase M28 [Paracoccaceae bacterium]
MKYSSFRIDDADFDTSRKSIEDQGGWWVRFGDEVLTYAANTRWSGVQASLGAENRSARQPAGEVRKGDMHLVVQKGRTFQQEHPDVEVIFDRGRYLVVSLPKEEAEALGNRDDVCFHVLPLAENAEVFRTVSPARSATAETGAAAEVVARVDRALFETNIARLVAWPTRFSTSAGYAEAAEWCRGQLDALGFDAELQPVEVPGLGASMNVVGRRAGVGMAGRDNVIVVAHLDSVNHPGGPEAPAPGADDNASGSAGLLTLAAALSGHEFVHDLTLVLVGGEEQGLHGSRQYLATLDEAERGRIRAVLNMDMIGAVNANPAAVLLEGHALSQAQIDRLAQAAADFTPLTVQTSLDPFASDHVPFIEAGIPAVLTIEGADGANDAIHTANDTLDRIDAGFAIQILRMNAGYLAEEAGAVKQTAPVDAAPGPGAPYAPPPQPPPVTAGPDPVQMARALAFHYQALLAQYARLGRDGRLTAQDYGHWQTSHATHAALSAYAGAAGGCGCGCGGCS